MVSSDSSSIAGVIAVAANESDRDVDLRRRVVSFLTDSNMPGLRQLRVDAVDGIVTLRGTVRTYYEKQLSQQRCKRVAGVVRLIDRVEVAN
ncbi:MAG: BON domain-containing protein [Planctomycetia bacterium]|nr:BON domain-containing protein [Planctomycetia bacterium]